MEGAFGPEEIAALVTVYDKIIKALHLLPGQYDPANEVIAAKVIELGRDGVKDPELIAAQIIAQYQNPTAGC